MKYKIDEVVVYRITNTVNGKIYVGSTIHYPARIKGHIRDLNKGNHHSIKLQRSWDIHGRDSFTFDVLEHVYDIDILREREQYYLDTLRPWNNSIGYNISKIAFSRNGTQSSLLEECELKRLAHIGIKRWPCSEETKKRISKSQLSRDKTSSIELRKHTILSNDTNGFKTIAEKSGITQRKNLSNSGKNNPRYNDDGVLIFDGDGNIRFETTNEDFISLCENNNLPYRMLIKSRISGGLYKLFVDRPPRKHNEHLQYKGWYCTYKNRKNELQD
jgi:group I intron endonuclease